VANATEPKWHSLQHLQDIDLAGNLLSDWSAVWRLLRAFPRLQKLSVASNYIGDWIDADNSGRDSDSTTTIEQHHQHLRHLNSNETRIQSMETVIRVGRALPALQELVLANNNNNNSRIGGGGGAVLHSTAATM
jgi:Leucine-rich repeat (LRR) protein